MTKREWITLCFAFYVAGLCSASIWWHGAVPVGLDAILNRTGVITPPTPEPAPVKSGESYTNRVGCFAPMTYRGTPIFAWDDCAEHRYVTIPGWQPCRWHWGESYALCKMTSLSAVSWWSHLDVVERCCDGIDNNDDGIIDDDCAPVTECGTTLPLIITVEPDEHRD
jgi:hypothetical protein